MRIGPILIKCTCCGQSFETFTTSAGYHTRRCFICRMNCPQPGGRFPAVCHRQPTEAHDLPANKDKDLGNGGLGTGAWMEKP